MIQLLQACKIIFNTVFILCLRTDGYRETVQTQISLLIEEQSDQDLHTTLFAMLSNVKRHYSMEEPVCMFNIIFYNAFKLA